MVHLIATHIHSTNQTICQAFYTLPLTTNPVQRHLKY